jgi:hypothetical protein
MEQDNTPPEVGWFYRRWFTFFSSVAYMGGLFYVIAKLDDANALKWVAMGLIGLKAIIDGLYLAGASVLDYAKLAASWKGNKDE